MASWEDMPIKGGGGQVFDIPLNTISSNAPAAPRTLDKKPFLKRNTGLQKRQLLSREKKCVSVSCSLLPLAQLTAPIFHACRII
jgi:hypothetical protein